MGEMCHECRARNKRCDYKHKTYSVARVDFFSHDALVVAKFCVRSHVLAYARVRQDSEASTYAPNLKILAYAYLFRACRPYCYKYCSHIQYLITYF